MSERWRPWQRLLPAWLPAVLLFIGAVAVLVWLSSDSLGQAAKLRREIAELEEDVARLERIEDRAATERVQVDELQEQVGHLFDEVFSSLDIRLTRILRAVGAATREAGLLPGRFSYSADTDEALGAIRFGIKFSVAGQYDQVRTMLDELQASPEFLIVEFISFTGESESPTQDLRISVSLATYLSEARGEELRRLVAQGAAAEERGGPDGD